MTRRLGMILATLFAGIVVSFAEAKAYDLSPEEDQALREHIKQVRENDPMNKAGAALAVVLFGLIALQGIMYVIALRTRWNEKKRRWNALPLPEALEPDSSEPQLRPEFRRHAEFCEALQHRELEGMSIPVITEKRELDKGYELLYELSKLPSLERDEVELLNRFGSELNAAQQRHACFVHGEYKGIRAFFLRAIIGASSTAYDMPAFKFDNPAPMYLRAVRALMSGIGLGLFQEAVKHARGDYDTVYVEKKTGRMFKKVEDLPDGCVWSIIIMMLMVCIAPFLTLIGNIAHYYRNYISNK